MDVGRPSKDFLTPIEDSRRWRLVPFRADDIVISTPPKCGTTWMQGIVSSLLWPDGDAPGRRGDRSPWVDVRVRPIEDVVAVLDDQKHRRFLKTHSPADSIPMSPAVRYLIVHRSAPDALVSWGNHRATLRPEAIEMSNKLAAPDGFEPLQLTFEGDYDVLFEEWSAYCSPARHLASWWPRRNEANVLLLHYADLLADLAGNMRVIAGFLDIAVQEAAWANVVGRCRIDAMRDEANRAGGLDKGFAGGAASFFYRGENGRGRRLLTGAQLERCRRHCAELLPDEAAAWLESGSAGIQGL